MLELSIEKLVVIGLIAAFLIGPERLPAYAAKLARLVQVVRGMANEAKGRLQEELGPDFDADWKQLDPRQYDPRRIIRNALTEDDDEPLRADLRPVPSAGAEAVVPTAEDGASRVRPAAPRAAHAGRGRPQGSADLRADPGSG